MKKETSFDNALTVLEVLKQYTDENHHLTATDIRRHTDISKTETVTNILARLGAMDFAEFSVELTHEPPQRPGFYLARTLGLAQAVMLVNLVQSTASLSRQHSADMIHTIRNMLSLPQRRLLDERILFSGTTFKTPNYATLLNIEIIIEAFMAGVRVQFCYLRYNNQKQLEEKGHPREVVPYFIVHNEGSAYLLAREGPTIKTFRLDKITNISLSATPLTPEEKAAIATFDVAEQLNKSVYMYIGNAPDNIELRCNGKQGIHSAIIERFPHAIIEGDPQGIFTAHIRAQANGIIYWALQYATACEIISPPHIREQVRTMLQEAAEKYKD